MLDNLPRHLKNNTFSHDEQLPTFINLENPRFKCYYKCLTSLDFYHVFSKKIFKILDHHIKSVSKSSLLKKLKANENLWELIAYFPEFSSYVDKIVQEYEIGLYRDHGEIINHLMAYLHNQPENLNPNLTLLKINVYVFNDNWLNTRYLRLIIKYQEESQKGTSTLVLNFRPNLIIIMMALIFNHLNRGYDPIFKLDIPADYLVNKSNHTIGIFIRQSTNTITILNLIHSITKIKDIFRINKILMKRGQKKEILAKALLNPIKEGKGSRFINVNYFIEVFAFIKYSLDLSGFLIGPSCWTQLIELKEKYDYYTYSNEIRLEYEFMIENLKPYRYVRERDLGKKFI